MKSCVGHVYKVILSSIKIEILQDRLTYELLEKLYIKSYMEYVPFNITDEYVPLMVVFVEG